MKYARLLTAFYFQPWAIRLDVHRMLGRQLQDHLAKLPKADLDLGPEVDDDEDDESEDHSGASTAMGVTVIPVHGIIGKHLGLMEMLCGGYDLEQLSSDLDDAAEDSNIHTVILDFDSPGGTTIGVSEMADKIKRLGESKTTIAYSSTQCCSAAYWLAAACNEFYAAPSSIIGSIGVYIAAIDSSRAWEQEGFKLKLFRDGALKGIGMDGKEWTPEEDAFLQEIVDRQSVKFKSFVREQRGSVADSTLQGQWFDGDQAVSLGLVDDTAAELRDVVTAAMAAHLLS